MIRIDVPEVQMHFRVFMCGEWSLWELATSMGPSGTSMGENIKKGRCFLTCATPPTR